MSQGTYLRNYQSELNSETPKQSRVKSLHAWTIYGASQLSGNDYFRIGIRKPVNCDTLLH